MKVFVSVLLGLFSVALATHHYPIHIPIIGKTGVPLEPAEVVHARHAHLSHYAAVKSHQSYDGGDYGGYAVDDGGSAYGGGHNVIHADYGKGYHGPYAHIGHDGQPVETPEVKHLKAAHFAAHAKAAAAAYGHGYGGGDYYRKRRSIYNYQQPIIGHSGNSLDAYDGPKGGSYEYSGGNFYGYPKLGHDGQPIETLEVQHAKAEHFAAHAKALAQIGGGHNSGYHGGATSFGGNFNAGHFSGHSAEASSSGHQIYHGPIHIPVIGPKGVPVDTPEVQAARHKHLAELAKASARDGYHHYEEKPYY